MNYYEVEFRAKKSSGKNGVTLLVMANLVDQAKIAAIKCLENDGYDLSAYFKPKATKTDPPAEHLVNYPEDEIVDETENQVAPDFSEMVQAINRQVANLAPGERMRLEGVPNEVYHKTTGFGSTGIKTFLDCPARLKADMDGLLERDESKFLLGSAIHDRLLLPEVFDREYVMMPDTIKRKYGKEYDAFLEMAGDRKVLSAREMAQVEGMYKAVMAEHEAAFSNGNSEVSYWFRHGNGVVLKARSDYEHEDLIIDLKSTISCEPHAIENSMFKFGYIIQDALYRLVTGIPEFAFIYVEKTVPHLVSGLVIPSDETRDYANLKLAKAISRLAECLEFNIWPGYETKAIHNIELPRYLLREYHKLQEGN